MYSPNTFVKGVVLVLDKVKIMLVPGKILDRGTLDFILLACLLIDNY